MNKSIFISHSSRDGEFVARLRKIMEGRGLWNLVDSRELRGKDESTERIHTAIEDSGAFVVIISPDAFNSAWVAEETRYASQVKEKRQENYAIIPLLREGVELGALKWIFSKKPMAIRVQNGPGGIRKAMPHILAALGKGLSDDLRPISAIQPEPVDELILELNSPYIEKKNGKILAGATAELTYIPANAGKDCTESREPFLFIAPLGPAEIEELRWYLEQYYLWPSDLFKTRAENVENKLPEWGQELYRRAMPEHSCVNVLRNWSVYKTKNERRFTIFVDSQLVRGSSEKRQQEANEASALLLGLPWELLHDGKSYLFQGAKSVRALRQLPTRKPRNILYSDSPLRILLISPNPDELNQIPSAKSAETLGQIEELRVLRPATLAALEKELDHAMQNSTPYHVIHFDGHDIFNKNVGSGGLQFQDIRNNTHSGASGSMRISAGKLAEIIQKYHIHLFFSRSLAVMPD